MKHVKLYEELKINEKQYHTYDLINLVSEKDLGSKGEDKMIDMIKSGQIDLNLQEQLSEKTALQFAMINRYEKVFDELIKSGADLDIQDENGSTALILSAMGSTGASSDYFIQIMYKLIDAGADWNKKVSYGSGNHKYFLDIVKDSEFKRHILKKYHKQYEIYLTKKKCRQIQSMKYLKNFEQNNHIDLNDQLISDCLKNDLEGVKNSIGQDADVNFINKDGYTPLIYSLNKEADIKIVKFLIEKGADVNFQDNTNQGWTPLLLAGFYSSIIELNSEEYYDILKLLIDSGSDWNIKGRTVKITFFDYLKPETKKKIIKDYPDKYKDYLLQQKADKFNL